MHRIQRRSAGAVGGTGGSPARSVRVASDVPLAAAGQSVGQRGTGVQHTVGFFAVDDHILPNVGVRGMSGGLGAESGVIKVMIDGRSVAYRTT